MSRLTKALLIHGTLFTMLGLHVDRSAAQGNQPSLYRVIEVGEVSVADSRRFLFNARNVDDVYQIDVVEANPPNVSAEKLPVVFVPGDGLAFQSVVANATLLSFDGIIPPTLVVGISYSGLKGQQGPLRDYTPTFSEAFLDQVSGEPELGGADAFLAFINEELKPFIGQRFPSADLRDTTIIGHSLSGLFAMHILFTEPGSFQRYVVVSPSLWWDDGVLQRTADTMPERSAKLFLSFGELEPRGLMHEPVARMDALLRSRDWPDFQYSYTVFSGVGHGSVVPLGHSQGLRAVFEPNMDEPPSE